MNEIAGEGREARRGDVAVVNLRLFLSRGEEVTAEYPDSPRTLIDLGQRETIAGLRYGVEGMCVGGRRSLMISPHLAYGKEGMGEYIPPNAALRCEVELLEVHDAGYRDPQSHEAKSWLSIVIPGLFTESTPRIQIRISDGAPSGTLITRARPDGSWRRAPATSVSWDVDAGTFTDLFTEATSLPNLLPDECLSNDQLWADTSETANSVTRDQATDTVCITIGVSLSGQLPIYYSLRRTSEVWMNSGLRRALFSWLKSDLREGDIP